MSVFNLSPAIGLLGGDTITVRRAEAETYDANGRASARVYGTVSTGKASVQNVRGDDLAKLPEGENATDWQTVYYAGVLLTGDLVDVPGKGTYEARNVGDWQVNGRFSKTFARKMGPTEPRAGP